MGEFVNFRNCSGMKVDWLAKQEEGFGSMKKCWNFGEPKMLDPDPGTYSGTGTVLHSFC